VNRIDNFVLFCRLSNGFQYDGVFGWSGSAV